MPLLLSNEHGISHARVIRSNTFTYVVPLPPCSLPHSALSTMILHSHHNLLFSFLKKKNGVRTTPRLLAQSCAYKKQ